MRYLVGSSEAKSKQIHLFVGVDVCPEVLEAKHDHGVENAFDKSEGRRNGLEDVDNPLRYVVGTLF